MVGFSSTPPNCLIFQASRSINGFHQKMYREFQCHCGCFIFFFPQTISNICSLLPSLICATSYTFHLACFFSASGTLHPPSLARRRPILLLIIVIFSFFLLFFFWCLHFALPNFFTTFDKVSAKWTALLKIFSLFYSLRVRFYIFLISFLFFYIEVLSYGPCSRCFSLAIRSLISCTSSNLFRTRGNSI